MKNPESLSPDPRLAQVQLLNVGQVSELLRLHPRTVWRMSITGEIPKPIKVGGKAVRWRLRDMESFVQGVKP